MAEALTRGAITHGHEAELFPTRACASAHAVSLLYWPGWNGCVALGNYIAWADIVHIHGLWTLPTSAAALLARCYPRPYIIMPHGMLDRWSLRRSHRKKQVYAMLIERRNLDQASALHFLNHEECEEAKDFGCKAPSFVLPNGVDTKIFQALPGKDSLLAQHPRLRGKILALFLGRLHPKKGLDLLIPALSRARKHVPALHLLIAGPDEDGYCAQVVSWVRDHGLDHAVTFLGEVTGANKLAVFAAADLFVLSSYQEGDSMAVKEALAAGLPVLITRACHFSEVETAQAGIVVQPNIDEVADALIKLGANRESRSNMSQNARRFIDRSYRWEIIVGQLMDVYQDIVSGRKDAACWHCQLLTDCDAGRGCL